ncbi:MAG: hypothetical protein IJF38_02535 [Clostridia bacterium]|nr:hypothetical protein [Clostridia bacterium]
MTELPSKEARDAVHKTITSCGRIEYQTLGKSILGEPIYLYRVGRGKRNILYTAAHHGSEYLTAMHLFSLLLDIAEGSESTSGESFDEFSLFFIPCVNPDGVDIALSGFRPSPLYERQLEMSGAGNPEKWKANARGVDLNHNYPYGFAEYKAIEAARGTVEGATLYSGEYPVSEPETRAVMRPTLAVDLSLVVSLHSAGEEIFYAPKGQDVGMLADRIAGMLGYRVSTPTGTACFGGLCDYTGYTLGIPSLTIETGRGESPLPISEFFREREVIRQALLTLPTLLPKGDL